ncbi:DNA polymerase I [Thalassotalea euphylliae]|uniref:DNA polymerase I n=1 Tax=Thalassotalea euphylliae TaxID=1655234 RepID=A0A3E0UJT4_9GAMM|nr:DNA polymerase I [Thalassotalea euphylliae]REL37140.1 DNA polymerase I [Thalassotalea euphylliae]
MASSALSPLILVDGSSYLFRAYHVPYLQALSTADGHPTGAITGVLNMIKSLQKDYPNGNIVVVFDAKGKTFRNDMYAEYKANRPPMPEDLRCQIAPLHEMIAAMGFPLLVIEGVEADDVIGTLAKQACEKSIETVISTGDKDMAQLVTEHVTLLDTMKEKITDIDAVKEKYGFAPEHMIDYLALMGDAVDNIPGMPGVGDKSAKALIAGIGGIRDIYERLDDIAGLGFRGSKSLKPKMIEHEEIVRLSYELATIKCDVELEQQVDELQPVERDLDKLTELFTQYELRRHLADLKKPTVSASSSDVAASQAPETQEESKEQGEDESETVTAEYDIILTEADFNTWLAKLKAAPLFAFDTETTSIDYMQAELVGLSFSHEVGKAAYVPVAHEYVGAPEQLSRDWVLAQLKPLLESDEHKKVGQNLKYDAHVLSHYNINLAGIEFDTMLESYCYNSVASRHNMDALAKKYLNHETVHFEDIAGKGAKQLTFNQIEIEKAGHYAAEDADITLRLHQALHAKLVKDKGPLSVFTDIELPLSQVLQRMESHGVLIDSDVLAEQSQAIGARLAELEIEAHNIAGKAFNLASPKQLREILFEELKIPAIKKTPSGVPSTAEEVLQELALDYPLPKLILEHRGLAKLKSTYTDKLPLLVQPKTGRVHTSYHQAVAATGRLSSTDPNLQNIPIRSEEGRKIRQAFIAPQGYKIVAIDYSQIELRIMAHLSDDPGLVKAFSEGKDVHSATAAEIFAVDVDSVTSDMRRSAKAINFGLIYGMSAFGLAKQIGVGRNQAQDYMNKYFERYPNVMQYMEDTRKQASEKGYVETLFGRRLYLPDIKARNQARKKAAERAAINAPMQGTAADIIKKAMLAVDQWIATQPADVVKMTMQVHDELIFEIKESELAQVTAKLVEIMNAAAELNVPLIAEAGSGDNWQQAH